MRIEVLTLFPEACEPFFCSSLLGRAQRSGLVEIKCHNIRDYSNEPHRKVDDRPFGGGPGMVMMCQPVIDAVEAVEQDGGGKSTRILLTPQGERLNQRGVEALAGEARLLLVAGHYEGFDERIRLLLKPRELSIGDFVLSGGEAAAMAVVDAVVRMIPGALGDDASNKEDTFSVGRKDEETQRGDAGGAGWLEYPQYTRPRVFRELAVPDVLLGGDHERIRRWRMEQSKHRTIERRPDLMKE